MPTNLELAELSDVVYEKTPWADPYWASLLSAGWVLEESSAASDIPSALRNSCAAHGYFAEVFKNKYTGEIVIANRGTQSRDDLPADFSLATGLSSAAQSDAINFAKLIAEQNPGKVIIETGHSLGGSEAQAAVAALTDQGVAVSGVTFNAPGVAANITLKYSADSYQIRNFYARGDLIHYAGGVHLGSSTQLDTGPYGIQFQTTMQRLLFLTPVGIGKLLNRNIINGVGTAHSLETTINYFKDRPYGRTSMMASESNGALLPPVNYTAYSLPIYIALDLANWSDDQVNVSYSNGTLQIDSGDSKILMTEGEGGIQNLTWNDYGTSLTYNATGDAVTLTYTNSYESTIVTSNSQRATLTTTKNGQIVNSSWRDADGSYENSNFDVDGRGNSQEVDANGDITVKTYWPGGGISAIKVSHADGSFECKDYYADGSIASEKTCSKDGGRTTTSYLQGGQISSVETVNSDGSGYTYNTSYYETIEAQYNSDGSGIIKHTFRSGEYDNFIVHSDGSSDGEGYIGGTHGTSINNADGSYIATIDYNNNYRVRYTLSSDGNLLQENWVTTSNGFVSYTFSNSGGNPVTPPPPAFPYFPTSFSGNGFYGTYYKNSKDIADETFTYSDGSSVEKQYSNIGILTKQIVSQADGTKTINVYDPVVGLYDPNALTCVYSEIDKANGDKEIRTYDAFGDLISENFTRFGQTESDVFNADGSSSVVVSYNDGSSASTIYNTDGTTSHFDVSADGISSTYIDYLWEDYDTPDYDAAANIPTPFHIYESCTLPANWHDVVLYGTEDLYIIGNGLDDIITANAGNDTLQAGSGNDTLVSGEGNVTMIGGNGTTSYRVNEGSGDVTIRNSGSNDLLSFGANVHSTDITGVFTSADGQSVATFTVAGLNGSEQRVRIEAGHLGYVSFGDGAPYSIVALIGGDLPSAVADIHLIGKSDLSVTGNSLNDSIWANDGNDTLIAGSGNDTLVSGAGNVTMIGGSGTTSYRLSGTGDATIRQGGNSDILCFDAGITANNITTVLSSVSGIAVATLNILGANGDEQRVRIEGGLPGYVTFGAGAPTSIAALVGGVLPSGVTELNLVGHGNLSVTGNGLNDTIRGNDGNDTLVAGSGNDTLVLWGKNGTFVGSSGQTTYGIAGSESHYSILNSGANDTLEFMAPFTSSKDVVASVSVVDGVTVMTVTDNSNNVVTIQGGGLTKVTFADGSTKTLNWTQAPPEIDGTTLYSSSNVIAPDGVVNIILTGSADISATGNSLNDVIQANSGNDTLIAGSGRDTLIAGSGNNTLIGYGAASAGGDTYMVGIDSGVTTVNRNPMFWGSTNPADVLSFGAGISADDVTATESQSMYGAPIVTVKVRNGGTVIVNNGFDGRLDHLHFADGSTASLNEILAQATTGSTAVTSSTGAYMQLIENLTLTGTDNLEVTAAGQSDAYNVITANSGHDTLTAGGGHDTLKGGGGTVKYVVYPNNTVTTILNSGAGDVLELVVPMEAITATSTTVNGKTIVTLQTMGGGSVIIENPAFTKVNYGGGSTTLDFLLGPRTAMTSDSNTVMPRGVITLTLTGSGDIYGVGNDSNNTIIANSGNDTLVAGSGLATLIGGAGNDTFVINNADDVIQAQSGGVNTVQTSVSYTAPVNTQNLTGTGNAAMVLTGNAQTTTICGNDGADMLVAGPGDETLIAGTDANFIVAGAGHDSIVLGAGTAVIALNSGDGGATIKSGSGLTNVLSLGGGIDYADLAFSRSGNDLTLSSNDAGAITFSDWYSGTENQTFVTLQMLEQAAGTYDPSSTNILYNSKVEQFDFRQLVRAFDSALATTPALTNWNLMDSLLSAHLASSDTTALGGDLGYYDGMNGNLTGVNLAAALSTLQDPSFGKTAQAVSAWGNISGGSAQLH